MASEVGHCTRAYAPPPSGPIVLLGGYILVLGFFLTGTHVGGCGVQGTPTGTGQYFQGMALWDYPMGKASTRTDGEAWLDP